MKETKIIPSKYEALRIQVTYKRFLSNWKISLTLAILILIIEIVSKKEDLQAFFHFITHPEYV